MHGQLVAVLHFTHDRGDIGKIELRMNTLGIHVHGKRDDIDVASTFAVTKQGALDTVGTGHQGELCRRHARTTVVMRMNTDNQMRTIFNVTTEPLNLVGIVIGRRHFYRGRQVHDHRFISARAIGLHDCFDDLNGKIHLGGGE